MFYIIVFLIGFLVGFNLFSNGYLIAQVERDAFNEEKSLSQKWKEILLEEQETKLGRVMMAAYYWVPTISYLRSKFRSERKGL